MDKTVWSSTSLIFLGLLIDSVAQVVCIPVDKIERAKQLIMEILSQCKVTVKNLQKLCGFLNFLCRCIMPGRAFTRRLYSHFSPKAMPYHHIRVNTEIKKDLDMWLKFLNNPVIYCRPFIDYSEILMAETIDWFTDASGKIGMGGYCKQEWFQEEWNKCWLAQEEPSIEYLELATVLCSIYFWVENYKNCHICLYCDNQAVISMINNATSSCRNCMVLIHLLTLKSLELNVRIFAKSVPTAKNYFADTLSRFQMNRFWDLADREQRAFCRTPRKVPTAL